MLLAEIESLFMTERVSAHRYRQTLLEAHRGAGKTVLLDLVQDLATAAGWHVIEEDAGSRSTPLLARLTDEAARIVASIQPPPRRRSTGAGAFGVSASWETLATPEGLVTLRRALERLLDVSETGLLITIDEFHEATRDEVQEIANTLQHLYRANRPVAVVLAGLPQGDDKEPTFMRRCVRPAIATVPDSEIARGLVETAAIADCDFEVDSLGLATDAAAGFPYMMQLVGYYAHDRAQRRRSRKIELADVRSAIPSAQRELHQSVIMSVDERLTDVEREFLLAMARDDGPSRMKHLAERMHQTPQYVNVYRERLLQLGLIRQIRRGWIDFSVPGHRNALRSTGEYAAGTASAARLEPD